MKLDFSVVENPWMYRLFWFVSLAWFILPAWVGPFGALLTDFLNKPATAQWTSKWVGLDPWLVNPQVRFLEFLSPPLVERWPGPIHGGLIEAHRYLFSISYGMLGWICVRLIWHQFQDWWLRIWWILIYWLVCNGFVQTVALLLIHFGVMTG